MNGNALSLRSIEVSLESTSRDFGPANPRTTVLSVELMNSTLLIDCHGAGDNFYQARSFQEIYLNLFVFYFCLFILA